MDDRPSVLPTSRICPPVYCKITYGNFEVDKWYFLCADDEDRLCQISELYSNEDGDWVRIRVHSIRTYDEGNYGDWIDDDDTLCFHKESDLEEDEDLCFYKEVPV